jgi:hypothetical protein
MFANEPFSLGTDCDNDCNLARQFDDTPSAVCRRNCTILCFACVHADNTRIITTRLPAAIAKMARDPVVQSARAAMELLVKMGALHNTGLVWRQNSGFTKDLISVWDIWSATSQREVPIASPSATVWQPVVTGDFNGDGFDDIFWVDRTDGLLAEWDMAEAQTTLPSPSGGGALPSFMYSISNKSKAFSGDLDGDGVSDIVFATTKTDPYLGVQSWFVTWLMQPGSIVPSMTSTSSASIDAVQGIGNFDGDSGHKADILFMSTTRAMSVALNGGAKAPITNAGAPVIAPADWVVQDVADFNADGKADILWYHPPTGTTAIWFMDGTALVLGPAVATVPPSTGWRIQGAGDIDHDGISDIIWEQTYAALLGGGPLSIWIMNADGTIRENPYKTVPAGAQLVGLLHQGRAAPANAPATAIAEPWCGFSSGTLRNPGFGAYETWQQGDTFDGGYGTFAGDVDGDGRAELVTLGPGSVTGMTLHGGSFSAVQTLRDTPFYGSHGTFLADFNGDGQADLVAFNDYNVLVAYAVEWFIPDLYPLGEFGNDTTVNSTSYYGQIGTLMGDFDGDRMADIVTVGPQGIDFTRSLGSSLAPPIQLTATPNWGSYNFLVDVDGDAMADLVQVFPGPGTIQVRRSTGSGIGPVEDWTPPGWTLGSYPVMLSDVDGDGRADVIMTTDSHVIVNRSTGSSFSAPEVWDSGGGFYGTHSNFVADFDGNGRGDFVAVGDGYIGAIRSQ